MAADSKEVQLRKTLTGVVLSSRKPGPVLDITVDNEETGEEEIVSLHFKNALPFAAFSALLGSGNSTVGLRSYLEESVVPDDKGKLLDIIDAATLDGINAMVESLSEMYSGNSSTTGRSSDS